MAKVVGSCIYVHKSNREDLLDRLKDNIRADVEVAIREMDYKFEDFEYEVIKYDKADHCISFIFSPDWNTANEPEVGDGWKLKMKGDWTWKFVPGRKKNKQIYHSKHLFVDPSFYDGFDVIASYNRTQEWNNIPNLDKKRIGNKDYWVELLKANGMEV